MTKVCSFVAVMLVMVLVCNQFGASEAGGTAPSQDCCARLKSQQPCICGFMKDPNLKQYVNSPNARKVAGQCGVSIPSC
ncbi:hypothetical protein H5410_008861 [Solanum commersonii]|uniref:Bifunctional inhibitor/plant lipid transfer protein/seed storage helical domain-containing protein n=1 Tax=Solanum commersonii TaxID=4109 RepID=A0A9J6AH15_SOLCO|nr:hypothetical protein H5410_008861 [Solanum commersonii]